jgi:hypothetical protein
MGTEELIGSENICPNIDCALSRAGVLLRGDAQEGPVGG